MQKAYVIRILIFTVVESSVVVFFFLKKKVMSIIHKPFFSYLLSGSNRYTAV